MTKFYTRTPTSIVLIWIGLSCLVLCYSSFSRASTISTMMYYTGQMILDPGVSFNEMTDHNSYVEIRGRAPSKKIAYQLAEKLLHSKLQKDLKFSDIIPFWKGDGFIFIFKKSKPITATKPVIQIETPFVRDILSDQIILTGFCSQESADLSISGDVEGEVKCQNGKWKVYYNLLDKSLPIMGVKVIQRRVSKDLVVDFRSFLIRNP